MFVWSNIVCKVYTSTFLSPAFQFHIFSSTLITQYTFSQLWQISITFPRLCTWGQLPRHGLHLSWNRFWREAFCSLAIILCKASFSSPSLSRICVKNRRVSLVLSVCFQNHYWKSKRFLNLYILSKGSINKARDATICELSKSLKVTRYSNTLHWEQHSLLFGNSGAFGKYCLSFFQASLETTLLSFSDMHRSPGWGGGVGAEKKKNQENILVLDMLGKNFAALKI